MAAEATPPSNPVVEAAATQQVPESSSKACHDSTRTASNEAPADSGTGRSCSMELSTNTQASFIRQGLGEVLGPHPATRSLPPVGPPRPGFLAATPEDRTALAGLMADAVSARLAEDVRAAVEPLLREQAVQFERALDRMSKPSGASASRRNGSPVSEMRRTDPSGMATASTTVHAARFNTAERRTNASRSKSPTRPVAQESGRAQTFDQFMLRQEMVRSITPTAPNDQSHSSIVPCDRRTNEESGQLDVEKMPSVERRRSLTKRLARWKNMLTPSGAEARQPSGLESIADARGSELLATVTERPGGFATMNNLPTVPKGKSSVPTRVQTCPDGFSDMLGAKCSKPNVLEHTPQTKIRGLKTVLAGRRGSDADGMKYASECNEQEDRSSGFYEILLDPPRDSSQRNGIDVTREGTTFIITAIHPDGLFAVWNTKNKDRQVSIGDKILEVNGSPEKVLETLAMGKCPRVCLQRGPRAGGPVSRFATDTALDAPRDFLASGHSSDSSEGSGRGRSASAQHQRRAARRSPETESRRGLFSLDLASAPTRKRASSSEAAPPPGAIMHAYSDNEEPVPSPSGQSAFGAPPTKLASIISRNLTFSTADKDQPAPRSPSRRLTGTGYQSATTTLRIEREDELLSDLTDFIHTKEDAAGQEAMGSQLSEAAATVSFWSHERKVQSPLLLCICGILPWQSAASAFYRPAMILLAAGFTVVFAFDLRNHSVAVEDLDCEADICLNFQHLCDLVLAVGSFLGLLAMRTLNSSKLLGSNTCLLIAYARRQDVVEKWSFAVNWQTLSLFILWVCSLAFRLTMVHPLRGGREALSTVAFALVSVIFMGITYGILHVSCAIAIMIDSYCLHLSHDPDLARGVREWNMLQALLRKVSRALERSFLVLQTTALAMVLISASSLFLHGTSDFWWPLSNVLLALSVGLNFFKAAEVTEKCTRVPSLVNSLAFSNDMCADRHYLVEYVTYSMAGFYVGEVRLTAGMALKFTYISGLFAFGVLTKLTGMG